MYKHTNIQNYKHTNIQTYKNTNNKEKNIAIHATHSITIKQIFFFQC
jgi:hypothetical protein